MGGKWSHEFMVLANSGEDGLVECEACSYAANLERAASSLPRGTLLRADIKEHMDGPDGNYLLLAPPDSTTPVAVRLDDLLQLGAKANLPDRKDPADGSWVLLCGMALSRFDDGKQRGLFLLPLEWMLIAAPPPPAPPRGGPGPGNPGPPPRG
jgi:hypothetical protein